MAADHKEPVWKIVDWTNEAAQLGSGAKKAHTTMKSPKIPNAKSKVRETKVKRSEGSTASEPVEHEDAEPTLLDAESRTMSPVVEARLSALELLDMSVELCLVCNSSAFALSLDGHGEVCVSDENVVICHDCGECYHTYCLDPPVASKAFLKPSANEWRCPHCKFCVLCQQSHNESNLVVCDRCDRCYHSYCAKLSPSELNGEQWLCSDCKICAHCHQSFSIISDDVPLYRRYALCSPCNLLYEQRIKPIADRIRALIKTEHEKRSFLDSVAPPPKRTANDSQPVHVANQSTSTPAVPPSNSQTSTEVLPKSSLPLARSLPPLIAPLGLAAKFTDMPAFLPTFSSHIPLAPNFPFSSSAQSFHSPPEMLLSPPHWESLSRSSQPTHLPHDNFTMIDTRGSSHPHPSHLAKTPSSALGHVPTHFSNIPPSGLAMSYSEPIAGTHQHRASLAAFQSDARHPQSISSSLNGTNIENIDAFRAHSMIGERNSSFHSPHESSPEFRQAQAQAQSQAQAHRESRTSEHHMPVHGAIEMVHGKVVQHASVLVHYPFSLPPEATLIVVSKNGGNHYPSPGHPWMQMFELSAEGYFRICGFFGGGDTFYQQLPAFFVPEGQFPILDDCPSADVIMKVLLQGATNETVPPFILPNSMFIPPGTMLLPPREIIQEKQRASSAYAMTSQHSLSPTNQDPYAPHNYGSVPPQTQHMDSQMAMGLGLGSSTPHSMAQVPPQLPLATPTFTFPFGSPAPPHPSQIHSHPSQMPSHHAQMLHHATQTHAGATPQPSHLALSNAPFAPSHSNQRQHIPEISMPGGFLQPTPHQTQQQTSHFIASTQAGSRSVHPQAPPSHMASQHSSNGVVRLDPFSIPGSNLASFGVSPPIYVNGHIDLSRHTAPEMPKNAALQEASEKGILTVTGMPLSLKSHDAASKGPKPHTAQKLSSKQQVLKKDANPAKGANPSSSPQSQSVTFSQDSLESKPKRRPANDPGMVKLKDLASKLHILVEGPPQLFILNMESYQAQKVDIGQLKSDVVSKYVGYAISEGETDPKKTRVLEPGCFFTVSDYVKYEEGSVPWRGRDERECMLCKKVGDHVVLGRLLPFQLVDQWVHVGCAMWSNEVSPSEDGELVHLFQAVRKAKATACVHCKEKGASVHCAVPGCQRKFHLPCLLRNQSRLVAGSFVRYAICNEHSKEYQEVKWLSGREERSNQKPLLDSRKDLPKGHFPWSHFDFNSKFHLSEADLRQKIAKQEGDVTLEQWTQYVFRSGALCVPHIGCISSRAPFHSKDYIFPVGYRAIRRYWSWKTPSFKRFVSSYPLTTASISSSSSSNAPPSSMLLPSSSANISISTSSTANSSPSPAASVSSHTISSPAPLASLGSLEWTWPRTDYEMAIDEQGGRLIVKIVAMDDPDHPIVSNDLKTAWDQVVARVNHRRANIAVDQEETSGWKSPSRGASISQIEDEEELRSSSVYMDGIQMMSEVGVDDKTKRDWEVVNTLPFGFYWGLESPHMASHLERLPGARILHHYVRKHDMVIRLPSVLSLAVARYFDPDVRPDILGAPPNESGAARCQPYKRMESLERFKQVDAMPCHPAASLLKFKELTRIRAKFNQPLYPQASDTNIRGTINAQNMTSYSKLTRFRLMKASENIRLKVLRSKIQGRGLFVMEDACEGEFLIEYVGEVISHRLADEREKNYQSQGIGCYMFTLNKNFVIDATTKGNASRFINHSCEPNCETQIEVIDGTPRIVIYAKHAIKHGEELTYDYHFEPELEKLKCYCGAPSCRGYMN